MPTTERAENTLPTAARGLLLSDAAQYRQRLGRMLGEGFLLLVASASSFAVLFIFYFILKDALPFFKERGIVEFFTGLNWFPTHDENPEFGVFPIFYGSAMVTLGSCLVAVPLGITAAICLSDVLSFRIRQYVKPVIEMLAAIPSVAYGFFALVVFAPLLQDNGGSLLGWGIWLPGLPVTLIGALIASDFLSVRLGTKKQQRPIRILLFILLTAGIGFLVHLLSAKLSGIEVSSGTNAFNVSIVLGIMALPTIVSVSEDALQAVSREIREGSYALGSTRAETLLRVVLPAAGSGICAAVILGIMRAMGETMVVWMAAGNSGHLPKPLYNFMAPVRTLTATIAGDMGEADQMTGSAHFHVLFAMALSLLVFSFLLNLTSEWVVKQAEKKMGKM